MSARPRSRRLFLAGALLAVLVQATAAWAQHASDNPVAAADDAFGLTLGLESIGLYGPGGVRGFSPQAAGNVRIDGLYFDQQGGLSNRVIEGSAIRVGVSEIGYAFPAPTGIVDYELRHPGDGTPSATIIANAGPYDAWGVSIDGSAPLAGKELLLPIGVSTEVSTQTPYTQYPGYTSRVTSAGATPQWSPNDKVTVRALIDWQETRDAKTFPLFFTAGDYFPPPIPRGYLGQNWARGRSSTLNLGGLIAARLSRDWTLNAGVFRSTADNPLSFADMYGLPHRLGPVCRARGGDPEGKLPQDRHHPRNAARQAGGRAAACLWQLCPRAHASPDTLRGVLAGARRLRRGTHFRAQRRRRPARVPDLAGGVGHALSRDTQIEGHCRRV